MRVCPTVTIIFPTHNGWEDTKDCLASIRNLNYPKEKLEVIVVDNASTDGTPEKIHKNFPGVTLATQQTNLGFAKAINLGVKRTSSELILITNNDVVFEKSCLNELVKALTSDPKIGAVGGRVYWKNQRLKAKKALDNFLHRACSFNQSLDA